PSPRARTWASRRRRRRARSASRARRRSSSTWACAPISRRSGCGRPPGSTPPASGRRRGRSSLRCPRSRRAWARATRTGRTGRSGSAEKRFEAAAATAPDDPQALVAAAVGRFTKARPADAFGRLGPLAKRFPHAATVRFHLGLMLLWLDQVEPARAQLRLAV